MLTDQNKQCCIILCTVFWLHVTFWQCRYWFRAGYLFWCFICKFKTALYTYSPNLWKKPCRVFGCIWCIWFALYLIIMGLLTKLLEKPTFMMCCFHSEMKVLLKNPQCAEFIVTYHVWACWRGSVVWSLFVVQWLNQ